MAPVLPVLRSDSPLPPLYAGWLEELGCGQLPAETSATCDDCVMCKPGVEPAFRPETKCCTYIPILPNFLVGRILADADPEGAKGRESTRARIERAPGVSPLGLDQPPVYGLLYPASIARSFGRSETLRCPHYVPTGSGLCSVWRHRNATCSTYFCQHVRGPVGKRFWTVVRELLGTVERQLARWCVLEMGLELETLEQLWPGDGVPGRDPSPPRPSLGPNDLLGVADPAERRRVWGSWLGREAEFYERTWQLVESLSWSDVLSVCGPDAKYRAAILRREGGRFSSAEIPSRLRPGEFSVSQHPADAQIRVFCAIGSKEVVEGPPVLLEVIHCFAGRTVADALRKARDELGVDLDAETLRQLVDFEILVEANAP